jgi:DtxR family Mn-dependent transcriptional regulator
MIPWDQVHEPACDLEHATSPLVEEHLAQFLGQPETCPHGHPVPDADGHVAHVTTYPLSALKPGQGGVVQSVVEEPELLQYLENLGLVPQASVRVDAVAPFDGPVTVRVGDAQHILGWKVASQIQIRLNVFRS